MKKEPDLKRQVKDPKRSLITDSSGHTYVNRYETLIQLLIKSINFSLASCTFNNIVFCFESVK